MRALVPLLAIALTLLLGCGDDEETTAVTTKASTVETTEAEPAGERPGGELSERGIGSVELGASTARVEQAFGAPDGEEELPGCELAGPNAVAILRWTWDLEDGGASIDFDAAGERFLSYRTSSSSLPTTAGVRIGDSFGTLRQSYGAILKRLDLGARSNESSGFWYVGKPAEAWLLFTVAGGIVKTIQGGDIQICE